MHLVGAGHRLQLLPGRLARFADIDRLSKRQVADLKQLVSGGIFANADDIPIADHRLLDAAELARPCKSPDVAEEDVETLAALLDATIKDVPFVGDVHGADAEPLESCDDRVQLLPVAVGVEFEGTVHVVCIVANACQENGRALLLASISQISSQFVVLKLIAKATPVVSYVAAGHSQCFGHTQVVCHHALLTPCNVIYLYN